MENTFLARPHRFISSGNKWPKEIVFFSTAQQIHKLWISRNNAAQAAIVVVVGNTQDT